MKKILVIDDAEYILESTSTLLGFEGYEVLTASNGFEGVDKAVSLSPDLIVCDISMPGMDGYEVLEKVRLNDLTKTTPFIFLTAFTDKTNMRSGMEKGADDYLFKPFTRDELIAAIEAQFKKTSILSEHYQERVDELSKNITNALPHEFRTLLNQIIGNAKFLHNNSKSLSLEEIQELSGDVLTSSQRMLKITENYLVYARIESISNNKIQIEQLKSYKTDEPGTIVGDILLTVSKEYERTNDLLLNDRSTGISLDISTDNFSKILTELIDNAFRFSTEGTIVKVEIDTFDNLFLVKITDSGRGMTNDQIKKIGAYMQFERDVYEQQGVGLGLSIAKKMVELHSGSFKIISNPNEGTIVELSLPFKL
jgi:CheY-like chemotaxis protein